MTILSAYFTTFWHGVLLASCLWLLVLNASLWYGRRKIRELRGYVRRVINEGFGKC